jgi:hypothetical protein
MKSMLFQPHVWQAKLKVLQECGEAQTRRLIKLPEFQPSTDSFYDWQFRAKSGLWNPITHEELLELARYHAGEVAYVKEGLRRIPKYWDERTGYHTEAVYTIDNQPVTGLNWVWKKDWLSPLHLPEGAARHFLKILSVEPQRLQEITEADAIAEGCAAKKWGTWWQGYRKMPLGDSEDLMHSDFKGETPPDWMIEPHRMADRPWLDKTAVYDYQTVWNRINGFDSWTRNPWCWKYRIALVEKP